MLLAMLVLASCSTVQTTQGGAVGVGRTQRMSVSEQQVEQAARQQYTDAQILQAMKDSREAGFSNDDIYLGAARNFSISSADIARIGHAGGIPGFAGGGDFAGGLRVVGESGPELEATGPSRIFNAAQTRSLLQSGGAGGGELVREMQALRDEVRGLRAEAQAATRHAAKTAGLLDRVTEGGRAVLTEAYT